MITSSDYMVHIDSHATLNAAYLINISKDSIQNKSYKFINQCIDFLMTNGSGSFQSSIVMIDGYNDSPEELYEILEVRSWVYNLFLQHPYFIYFVSRELDSHLDLLSCAGDIEVFYAGEKTLSPVEYARLGINPLTEVEKKRWTLSINEILYKRIERSLLHLGNAFDDLVGVNDTINMLAHFKSK